VVSSIQGAASPVALGDRGKALEGQSVLLVSHGDTLSILQALVAGTKMGAHRTYGLRTAQLHLLSGSQGN